jgi:glucosamine--fructose-6-phosphate aminotransferase (isomerizing)
MCGIVGAVGSHNVVPKILEGLKKLEYRGYDSAGIAAPLSSPKVSSKDNFQIIKQEGKIAKLEELINKLPKNKQINSDIAIGHTRWATHGKPSVANAHPHAAAKICVVHNGTIENFLEIKNKLQKNGVKFLSQTDTEIIPHLIEFHLKQTKDLFLAITKSIKEISGSYALAIIVAGNRDLIIAAKKGPPLLIAYGNGENFVSSDYYAIQEYSNKVTYLEDGQLAFVTKDEVEIFDQNNKKIKATIKIVENNKQNVGKENFAHFMLKEIHEQPRVIEDTIQTYVDLNSSEVHLPNFPFDLKKINKITIVACGTSFYAGMFAKYLLEEIAKIEVEVDIASEFRYRKHPFCEDNLMIFISQSGETADTIAALKYAKSNSQKILSIVNAPQSSMAHLSDMVIRTVAGPEVGVASTKAHIAQSATLSLLAIELGFIRKSINLKQKAALLNELNLSGNLIAKILEAKNLEQIQETARFLLDKKNILFIGRGISYVTALEGSLKLRELSYINSQGIAAGELKHGSIALIDKKVPVIVIAPQAKYNKDLFEKTLSNAFEVAARGGKVILVSDKKSADKQKSVIHSKIIIPEISGIIQESIVPIISMQLLAYYIALFKGNDVDQPRNLAKSVTVE